MRAHLTTLDFSRYRLKILKTATATLWAVVLFVLIATTVLEKIYGTTWVHGHIYGAWWFVALWIVGTLVSVCYIFRRKLFKRPTVFLLHLSLLVILVGALVTFCSARHGTIHLRAGETSDTFISDDGCRSTMSLYVCLDDFEVVCYPGTRSAADYVATLTVCDFDGHLLQHDTVSMNRILSCRGYRFYQSGYDDDEQGCTLMVAHDPWGIAITYSGYALLLLSVLLFIIFNRQFSPSICGTKTVAILAVMMFATVETVFAASAPKVLPRNVAAEFGNLHVYYNGRISPLQTLAKDFTVKLYGKPSYMGYTSEQIFTGWMFWYSDWKKQPMIKLKKGDAARLLETDERYVSLEDFRGPHNEYRLDEAIKSINHGTYRGESKSIVAADEKFNLITSFYSGQLMKIYPCRISDDSNKIEWFSQCDRLPDGIDDEEWFFVKKSWDYVFELVMNKKYDELSNTLVKIRIFQQKNASAILPATAKFKAEKLYNRIAMKPIAMIALLLGIVLFVYHSLIVIHSRKRSHSSITVVSLVAAIALLITMTAVIALRWIIGGHVPLSNGSETMQFMAWCSLVAAVVTQRKYFAALPFGLILCGLTVAVSVMGDANPQITLLMPVLASPLMSIHVAVIMVSYVLFAFMMLNGVSALIMHILCKNDGEQVQRLYFISRNILRPAVFCLAVGIFIGAVWANISWGTYWNWDPKEVWALITLMIYASALHCKSISAFRRPIFFHIFTVAAFFSVIITYFGVNYLLGGMHGYVG